MEMFFTGSPKGTKAGISITN